MVGGIAVLPSCRFSIGLGSVGRGHCMRSPITCILHRLASRLLFFQSLCCVLLAVRGAGGGSCEAFMALVEVYYTFLRACYNRETRITGNVLPRGHHCLLKRLGLVNKKLHIVFPLVLSPIPAAACHTSLTPSLPLRAQPL